jgi:20S proteasome alpha/beta subunit
VKGLDLEVLSKKMDGDECIYFIGTIFYSIARADKEIGGRLVNSIDLRELKEKLEEEENIQFISWCIARIVRASKEVGEDLLKSIKKTEEVKEFIKTSIIPKMEEYKEEEYLEDLRWLTRE